MVLAGHEMIPIPKYERIFFSGIISTIEKGSFSTDLGTDNCLLLATS
jgi:hypothetical protein